MTDRSMDFKKQVHSSLELPVDFTRDDAQVGHFGLKQSLTLDISF